MKKLLFIILLAVSASDSQASHIVGGELYYDCLGNNQYQLTLKLYRDCYCTNCAPFGDPEYLTIFDAFGNIYTQPDMAFPGAVQLTSTVSNPCLIEPDICVERAVYTTILTLPPTAGGYNIVYQRCCRNNGVANIPIEQGATYQVHIPGSGQATCNSSPRFNGFPPLFICNNAPLVLDHSATDPDGDQLVYSLCDPYDGGSATCPNPIPTNAGTGCPSAPPPPPYSSLLYNFPFSAANFLNSPSNTNNLTIDPQTGVITGTPNSIGMFVVAVCVSEYRNGVFLGEMRRDFQFNVAPCNIPVANIPSTNINPQTGVGTYVLTCKNFTVNFTNTSYNPPPAGNAINYHWDFGVTNQTNDTSNLVTPTFTYPDTGSYLVTLIAVKDAGGGLSCTDTTYAYVYVYPNFNGNFSTANICQDSAATFIDLTTSTIGTINLWNWNFGDGTSSTTNNTTHTYAAPGNYNVTLISGNDLGCRDTIQKNITIYEKPNVDFTYGVTCINQPVTFTNNSTGSISQTNWNFGNGNTSTQQSPTYTYNNTGNFDVSLLLVSANGCKDTLTKNLTINPAPVVANNDTAICLGQSVQLHASGGTTYIWNPGTAMNDSTIANPTVTPVSLSPVTYQITAVNQYQCSATDVVTITVYPSANIFAGPDTSICLSAGSFRDSVRLSAAGGVSYNWSPAFSLNAANIANPVARPTTNTTYIVTGVDVNGCPATDSVVVFVLDPNINIVLDDSKNVCLNDTTVVNVINQGTSNYTWTPNLYLVNGTTYSPGFYPPLNTTYTLSVSNYCYTKSDSVQIVVLPLPTLTFNHIDSVCFGESVQLFVSGAQSYVWNYDSTLSALNLPNPFAAPESSSFYYVSGTDVNGCVTEDSTFVFVVDLPVVNAGNDTLIWRDTYAILGGSTNASVYYWSPSTFLDDYRLLQTKAEPTKTQNYVLYAENDFGCVNYDTVLILVESNTLLMLPTAFSPNGDGVNDGFRILRYLNILKLKEFAIYNRWGERVFSTTDINEGWDGTFRNKEQELGVYVWQVVAISKDLEEIVKKGNVTLVR